MNERIEMADWIQAMVDSTRELATDALGLAGCTLSGVADERPSGAYGSYISLVSDTHSLELGLISSREGCGALSRALLCMEPGDELSDEDLADAMGEVMNIVGGGVKTRMVKSDESLKLGLPLIIDGSIEPTEHVEEMIATATIGDIEVHLLIMRTKGAEVAGEAA